jgi:Spy/CpxP family protein refolding chaperone
VNWDRVKPWLLMGLIFAVGIVTGAALTLGFRSDFTHAPDPHQIRTRWLAHLTERLNLTADQQTKIQPILTDAGNQIQSLHREEVDRISQIMEKANHEIAFLLTADQQAELKQMESERERTFSGHMRAWGDGHGHSGPGLDGGFPHGPPPGNH